MVIEYVYASKLPHFSNKSLELERKRIEFVSEGSHAL